MKILVAMAGLCFFLLLVLMEKKGSLEAERNQRDLSHLISGTLPR